MMIQQIDINREASELLSWQSEERLTSSLPACSERETNHQGLLFQLGGRVAAGGGAFVFSIGELRCLGELRVMSGVMEWI